MYRHSGLVQGGGLARPRAIMHAPQPDEIGEEEHDAELTWELERKREEINEQIRRFKEQKDREFRDFERELRGRRMHHNKHAHSQNSALNLLAETKKQSSKSRPDMGVDKSNKKARERNGSPKTSVKSSASKPTLSLERTSVNGTTTPPVVGTPPHALRPLICRSPVTYNIALTPPRSRSPQSNTPAGEKEDRLARLFTPAYLPLLEGRAGSRSPISPPALSPRPGKSRRLGHNLPLPLQDIPAEAPMASSSLPLDTSVPAAVVSPPETSPRLTKRAVSVPAPSSSLPSALRTASGSNRKRKHVTFQMNDGKVVEPSSSYEEMPTPDLPASIAAERGKIDEAVSFARVDGYKRKADAAGIAESFRILVNEGATSSGVPAHIEEQELAEGLDGLGISSTDFGQSEVNEDGGSGVGFFELDEELESPSPLRSPRSASDGFFDDVEGEEAEAEPGGGAEAGSGKMKQKRKTRTVGNGKPAEEVKYGSFAAGSVPIDIVRPSGSWIGSFGH